MFKEVKFVGLSEVFDLIRLVDKVGKKSDYSVKVEKSVNISFSSDGSITVFIGRDDAYYLDTDLSSIVSHVNLSTMESDNYEDYKKASNEIKKMLMKDDCKELEETENDIE